MSWGEFFGEAFGPLILEGAGKVVLTILRVPGVLLETAWKKERSFEATWEKGSKFWQVLIGAACYTVLILLAIAAD